MSPPLGSEQSCGAWRSSPTTVCRSWPTPRQGMGSAATSSTSRPRKTVSTYEAGWSGGGGIRSLPVLSPICMGGAAVLFGVWMILLCYGSMGPTLGGLELCSSSFSPSLWSWGNELFIPCNPVMWPGLPSQGSPNRCSSWAWTTGLPPGRRQNVFWTTGQSQGLLGVGGPREARGSESLEGRGGTETYRVHTGRATH